jgi:hypothetical protein
MKTTELYLEQVLIGFLIVFIAAMPWIPELWAHPKDIQAGISIIGGSAALGFAFFIGIPFDRLADTLSERLDKQNRLKFALGPPLQPKPKDRNGDPIDDPYPEDMLLIVCRRDQQTVTRAQDYLRSRVRLTRALAAYAPAIAFIATLSTDSWTSGAKRVDASSMAIWFGIVAAGYLAWALLVLKGPRIPRTSETAQVEDYMVQRPRPGRDARTFAIPALLLVASLIVGLANVCDHPLVLAAALAGAALTILSAWSWWRISTTYRQFLSDCWRFSGNSGASKPS